VRFNHREGKDRGETARVVLPSYSWTINNNFSDDGYSEYATVAVSKQEFSTGKQKNSFIVMIYSEFFT
jgi:hypothetical protein